MRAAARLACLACLLSFGTPVRTAETLVNQAGVPLRLLVTRIQAGGAVIQVAIHPGGPTSPETSYLDTFSGNHERSVLPLDLPAGGAAVFSAQRSDSAPRALQEIFFRVAPVGGEAADLAEDLHGLWVTYSVAPGPEENLVNSGDEMENALWEIVPPGPEDTNHRIILRRSGWRLPCVIL